MSTPLADPAPTARAPLGGLAGRDAAYGGGAPEAAALIGAVRALGASFLLERSVKLLPGVYRDGRFLVSVRAGALGPDREAGAMALFDRIGVPAAARRALLARVGAAHAVHLGFEPEDDGVLFKVYLERPDGGEAAIDPVSAKQSILIHHAVKFDPARPERFVTSEYRWPRPLTVGEVEAIALGAFDGVAMPEAMHTAIFHFARVAEAAQDPGDTDGPMCLVVTEPGAPRRSFDLNLYDTGLSLAAARPWLEPLGAAFRVGHALGHLLTRHGSLPFGHLAGGVARDGRPFATVYYGVEEH